MLLLASASPQRRLLLQQAGIDLDIITPDFHEDHGIGDAETLVHSICHSKFLQARGVLATDLAPGTRMLVADTMVFLDHHRLGKPRDPDHARHFLSLLSGREHLVISGFCLGQADKVGPTAPLYRESRSKVRFRTLGPQDLEWYLATGEWQGAAGAYRIQGAGACLIERIEGSWTGIMGLPMELVIPLVRDFD